MTTQFEIDCALMAGAAYVYTRPEVNQFPIPALWAVVQGSYFNDPVSGFEAISFQKGTEVVISYAGTGPGITDWMHGNVPLALGSLSDQLRQAADYYLQVKASVPAGTHITLTGHSLGGGLASLIAVLFDESAITFDQAPFRNAALVFTTTDANGISTTRSAAQDLRDYLTGRVPETLLARLDAYLTAANLFNTNPNAADTLTGREAKVTDINVQGEVLGYLPFSRIGTQSDLLNNQAGASSIDLHSQALLWAFLQSAWTASINPTTNTTESLSQVTYKLPDLLKMIFDNNLFSYDPSNKDVPVPNFLERLIRHEAGVRDRATGAILTPADAMLTRFTRDLWMLAQDGGLTMNDGNGLPNGTYSNWNNVSKALTAFAMQMYYEDTSNATNPTKQLFTGIAGGIQFDMADVSMAFKAAFDNHKPLKLDDAKGYKEYFSKYLSDNPHAFFTPEELAQINAFLPYMRDWYVQAGTVGMVASDTLGRGAFMLGGNGDDQLAGGSANDLLVGNAGNDNISGGAGNDILLGCQGNDVINGGDGVDLLIGGEGDDTLDGGKGNDILHGGAGNDTYAFTGAYGTDIISDSDGSGKITVDGETLTNATQIFGGIYKNEAQKQVVVKLNGGNSLVILKEGEGNRILVTDLAVSGTLGIDLQANTPTTPAVTLAGDFKKALDPNDPNKYWLVDGNYVSDGAQANAPDVIAGTDGNDVIDGLGGDDALSGRSGDDYIIGGAGSDFIQAGLGKDTVFGGSGDDIIYGSSDAPFSTPVDPKDTYPANPYPYPQGSGFSWTSGYYGTQADGVPDSWSNGARNRLDGDAGNMIDGGSGNDFIAAGTGADYVHGGDDNDEIWGMDGGDILFGDDGNDLIWGDGNQPGGNSVVWTLPENHGNDVIDGGRGNDYLYGQGGDDIVFGGDGDDCIWGDDEESRLSVAYHGNDFLFGGDGNDQMSGGAGNDYLEGGRGNDTMVGGAGADIYYYNVGDGVDTIYDNPDEKNIIRFGAGVDPNKIKLGLGSLMLDLGNGDAVHIANFNQNDVFHSSGVGSFEFADGTSLSVEKLLERGFDLDGTAGDDSIAGTNTVDRIRGFGGNDTLIGAGGADSLDGGDGQDLLVGDADNIDAAQHGNDTLDGGAGNDQLVGGGGNDFLLGGAGDDQLWGDDGTLAETDHGDDTLNGGDGNDQLVGQGGSDVLYGGTGDDQLWGDDSTIAETADGNDTLDGGEGNDQLSGQGGSDVLYGGAGNDWLWGGTGDDTLVGGQGFDQLYGGAGDDTYVFNPGDTSLDLTLAEMVDDQEGINHIQLNGDLSIDAISLAPAIGFGADVLWLQAGQINIGVHGFLTGAIGSIDVGGVSYSAAKFFGKTYTWSVDQRVTTANATLQGGKNADTLIGTGGNSTFAGGLGNDVLTGSGGHNVYCYDRGDGVDTISDTSSQAQAGTVLFGAGIAPDDLVLSTDNGALVIGFGPGQPGGLRLTGFNANNALQAAGIDRFQFADGTVLTHAQLVARGFDLTGTAASETVTGTNLADRLTGGAGNDTLAGGGGADTYIFNIGDGIDVIADGDSLAGGNDTLLFGAGIAPADILALRNGNDVTLVRGADRVTLRSYFSGGANAVERIEFTDGTQWSQADVLALVQASASHDWVLTGDDGNNLLYGLGGNDLLDGQGGNDTLYGGSGNDTLIGGAGSDTLYGEAGSDTYLVGLNTSQDLIDETSDGDAEGIDTLQFVDGINRANVTFYRSGTDLLVQGVVSGQWLNVTVKGQFAGDNPAGQVERFVFADGTVMTAQDVKADVLRSSVARDYITGFETADSISGGWSGDYLAGGGGNDTLHGDQGNDTLYGEAGADQLFGDSGNDLLWGGDGDDTLDGGAGWDRLDGGAGNDTYLFGLGYGNDVIVADASGMDRVQLAAGLTAANVTLHRVSSPPAADLAFKGDSLVIQLNGSTDQLWIANYFDPAAPGNIETIRFADGTTWDYTAITARLSTQGGTANTLTGTNKANTFVVDHWNDVINDTTLNDGDKVTASVSYRLPETITDLTLTGTLNLFGVDTSASDILRGNAGNNWFESSTGFGYDTLAGGKGDDVYVIKGTNESVEPNIDPTRLGGTVITELAGEGIDTLISGYWSTKLPDNVENLVLGTPNTTSPGVSYYPYSYNDFSHKLIGNTLDNTLDASIYEDLASGQDWFRYQGYNGFSSLADFRLDGGAGADTLIGGRLNDTYVIDNVGEVVVETGVSADGADYSNDTVETPFETSLLTQFPHIENITLTGTAAVSATGNALANRLDGSLNTAANRLIGGAGNDTYVVGAGDIVVEFPDEGIDTVVVASAATSTVSLADYPNVENLRLQRNAGNLNAVGNAQDNQITGSLGNNQLSGGGGNDTIADQFLNDISIVWDVHPAADNDLLEGGDGDDSLISRGGMDTLDGGAGDDQLRVYYSGRSTTLRFGLGDGHDTLFQDFNTTVDVTVEFKSGIGPRDVQVQRQSGLVTFTLADGSSLAIPDVNAVSLQFADGTFLGPKQIEVMLRSGDRTTATAQDDLLFGTASADTLVALAGDDAVYANGGADLIDGGAGNDTLFGGAGADTLVGGTGNDILAGGTGADIYRFSRGFGQDVVDDNLVGGTAHGTDDGAVDAVEFDATVLPTDVAVYRQVSGTTASGLVLALAATGDTVAIQNAYAVGGAGAVELVRFANGTQWDLATLKSKIVGEVGYDTDDTLNAPVTASYLAGGGGADTLNGSSGNDTLDGGTGIDFMTGYAGDDTYFVDSLSDYVIEASRGGTDTVIVSVDNYTLPSEVERLQMATGTSPLHGTGNALNNTLIGNAGNNWLDGGTGSDTMIGGMGDDTYVRDSTGDVITENAGEGFDLVNSSLTYTLAVNLEALVLTGTSAINGTGNTLANYLRGNAAINTLNGGTGNDILDGGDGNDTLTDTSGTALFNGGAGTDTITGGASAEIFLGGLGNDTYTTAGGNDIVLFNKGDGQDTFAAGGTGSDTLSLGGGIGYADLSFTKSSSDLVLKIGASDQITFKNWYATTPSKPVVNLQVIAEAMANFAPGGTDPLRDNKVEEFNFAGLVGAFDAALKANPSLTSWALTNALANFQLAGSDTAAIGGDLAYQYGRSGTLAGIGAATALATLSDANLGSSAQALSPLATLQTGPVRLS